MIRRVTVPGVVNPFRGGAAGNRVRTGRILSGAVDAKPSDLPMGRLKRP